MRDEPSRLVYAALEMTAIMARKGLPFTSRFTLTHGPLQIPARFCVRPEHEGALRFQVDGRSSPAGIH